jgi:AcrR family transcriptional regulator
MRKRAGPASASGSAATAAPAAAKSRIAAPAAAKSRAAAPAAPRPRAGRPSRAAAEQLGERILEVATELLLKNGYGATSIETIASQCRVSKRTFYHRYAGKPALMTAVVVRLIDSLRPPAGVSLAEGEGLEAMLIHLAALILRAALTPRALQLHRLMVAESSRFPELAAAVAQAGGRQEAEHLIGQLLLRHGPRAPEPAAPDAAQARFAAQQFLQMVMSLPQLRALGLGAPMNAAELAAWPRACVALFLDGFTQLAAPTDGFPQRR